jgi:hypothetical protein
MILNAMWMWVVSNKILSCWWWCGHLGNINMKCSASLWNQCARHWLIWFVMCCMSALLQHAIKRASFFMIAISGPLLWSKTFTVQEHKTIVAYGRGICDNWAMQSGCNHFYGCHFYGCWSEESCYVSNSTDGDRNATWISWWVVYPIRIPLIFR